MKASTTLNASVLAVFTVLAVTVAAADDRDERIKQLEKRLEILEKRNREIEQKLAPQESRAADLQSPLSQKPKGQPTLSIGSSGFILRSADTNFALRFRGLLQVDSRWYPVDGGIDGNDGFSLRRARPIIEGTLFRDFEFRFAPEFGGSSTSIRDAWLSYNYNETLQFIVGKMKPPGGLERRQSVANVPFIERSLVSSLWPSRELGLMLQGDAWAGSGDNSKSLASEGAVHYAIGLFNGTGDDRAAANSDFDGRPEMAARLFFHPFLKTGPESLRAFGLGVAGTFGHTEGVGGLPSDGVYGTEGQQDMFTYLSGDGDTPATANVTADGRRWRLGPQAYWYCGPFGLQGEYGISSQELLREDGEANRLRVNHQGWAVTASWLLTGEDSTFKAVTPKRNFDPHSGGFGALQFVARYSVLDFDDGTFPNFADPTESATRANAWGVGLNWYLNRNVRASLNFLQTDFKGGAAGTVTRQNENVVLTRAQVVF